MDEAKVKEDRSTVIGRILPKIKKMAKRFHAQYPSVAVDDLQQAGAIGLLKAMDGYDQFDPTRSKLETWVHRWIDGEMRMHVRKDAATHRYEREAADAFDEEFQKREIGSGNALGDAIIEVAERYSIGWHASHRTPEVVFGAREAFSNIEAVLSELDEREREFIRLRYVENLTLDELAVALGQSREHLWRLDQVLRAQLRKAVDGG